MAEKLEIVRGLALGGSLHFPSGFLVAGFFVGAAIIVHCSVVGGGIGVVGSGGSVVLVALFVVALIVIDDFLF